MECIRVFFLGGCSLESSVVWIGFGWLFLCLETNMSPSSAPCFDWKRPCFDGLKPLEDKQVPGTTSRQYYNPTFDIAPEQLPSQKESSLPTIIFQGPSETAVIYRQTFGCIWQSSCKSSQDLSFLLLFGLSTKNPFGIAGMVVMVITGNL